MACSTRSKYLYEPSVGNHKKRGGVTHVILTWQIMKCYISNYTFLIMSWWRWHCNFSNLLWTSKVNRLFDPYISIAQNQFKVPINHKAEEARIIVSQRLIVLMSHAVCLGHTLKEKKTWKYRSDPGFSQWERGGGQTFFFIVWSDTFLRANIKQN